MEVEPQVQVGQIIDISVETALVMNSNYLLIFTHEKVY